MTHSGEAKELTPAVNQQQVSAVMQHQLDAKTMFNLVANGDLSKLNDEQKLQVYRARCEAAGLDPRTQPFQIINMQGKQVLYALKGCTDQLASKHGIVCEITSQSTDAGIRTVVVRARSRDGRQTDEIGCVNVGNLQGDALCNAYMKAVTKAKRRGILSLCGLGMMDESEAETVNGAVPVPLVIAETPVVDKPTPMPSKPVHTPAPVQSEPPASVIDGAIDAEFTSEKVEEKPATKPPKKEKATEDNDPHDGSSPAHNWKGQMQVLSCSKRDKKKDGTPCKPYYNIKVYDGGDSEGFWLSTYDDNLAAVASSLKDKEAIVEYYINKAGFKTLKNITPRED